ITVVLCGSFSDQDGVYKAGDFIVRQPGETHRPMVTEDEECICLSVCDAPVKFTGVFTRLLNPLVAYQHKH
ncbi:MAG: cupin domain-containing protein, partial [Pseudomonadota bacterium]